MKTLAEQAAALYSECRQDGGRSGEAWECVRFKAKKLGGKVVYSSNDDPSYGGISDYPTLIYQFPDNSRLKLMFGGVSVQEQNK